MKQPVIMLILLSLALFSCQKEEYAKPTALDEELSIRSTDRPFKGRSSFTSVFRTFDGTTVSERWEGSGHFTHLGNTTIVIHQFVTAGQLSGTIELTAANGDQLIMDYTGGLTSLDPVTLEFTSATDFNVIDGTGRFTDADGSGSGTGSGTFPNFPPGPNDAVTVHVVFEGTISY